MSVNGQNECGKEIHFEGIVGIKHLYVRCLFTLIPYYRRDRPSAREKKELRLGCIYWKKKTAATANSARTGVLAWAEVAAAPVLEALAAAEVDEPRVDVPELDVARELPLLLEIPEEEEVKVGETMVVLR